MYFVNVHVFYLLPHSCNINCSFDPAIVVCLFFSLPSPASHAERIALSVLGTVLGNVRSLLVFCSFLTRAFFFSDEGNAWCSPAQVSVQVASTDETLPTAARAVECAGFALPFGRQGEGDAHTAKMELLSGGG